MVSFRVLLRDHELWASLAKEEKIDLTAWMKKAIKRYIERSKEESKVEIVHLSCDKTVDEGI